MAVGRVYTVHGINTQAKWQHLLGDALPRRGKLRPETFNYGKFGILKFMSPWHRKRMVDRFYDFYHSREQGARGSPRREATRPSVIAHSFGTYIVGHAMQKYPDIRFEKVLLCGSILPRDFDWTTLIGRDQVRRIRNDYGLQDIWVRLAPWIVPGTGPSGAKGFSVSSPLLTEERFILYWHSDYLRAAHFDGWFDFLESPERDLRVVHGHQIQSGELFTSMRNAANQLDVVAFRSLPGFDVALPPRGHTRTWVAVEPDIYTFLTDRAGKVRGYVNAMPVVDSTFQKVLNGTIDDGAITDDEIVPYTPGAAVNLYLMSIVIDEEARNAGQGLLHDALERLMCGVISKLESLATSKRVTVKQVAAIGWTARGRRLCELLGMRRIGKDKYGNDVFHLRMSEAPTATLSLCASFERLRTVYRKLGLA